MTQEQLMKVKIKYLEDRLTTMEKSLGRIHRVMAHYQMIEDKESKDPFIKVMEHGESNQDKGESDYELI